jgi:segregation and condensation protein B
MNEEAEILESNVEETVQECDLVPLLPLLQALLISSSEPLSLESLTKACESSEDILNKALELLEKKLQGDDFGFLLLKVAKGYQLRTKPQYSRYIGILKEETPRKLSSAALETLAVVAYRQPVVKHDIDGIRGVDVAPTLKTLIDRGLVEVVGHKDTVGHPALYGTTIEFLKVFGLNDVEDLPQIKEFEKIQTEPGESAEAFKNPAALENTEPAAV